MNKLKASVVILLLCVSYSTQFSDDLDPSPDENDSCMEEGTLPCWAGGCFHHTKYCDGVVDCDDGTDENFCAMLKPDLELCNSTHQYMCTDNSACIPLRWICNNVTDCEDGSDEANCTDLPPVMKNATDPSKCLGFECGDGKCISQLWLCDGVFDCKDRTDEEIEMCKHTLRLHNMLDGSYCQEIPNMGHRNYRCQDMTFCLPQEKMCDGLVDCRDGSDEGPFCDKWKTMCDDHPCAGNETMCLPDRNGPACICPPYYNLKNYNYVTRKCDDVDECLTELPQCSQSCVNLHGHFHCVCDPGYIIDMFHYLCYAPDPEGLLFFSTRNEIRYYKIRTKQNVTVATDIKMAHGVVYDGTYVYWVETAQGHQAIFRAQLEDVQETKQVLVALGLEEPGDIAIDYLGGNIYFSDSGRGIISACRTDGSICTTINTKTTNPKFVTLHPGKGKMYWADWQSRAVIMSALMDGSQPAVLADNLHGFATGLALDAPNDRLYFVDRTIKVVMLTDKLVYSLLDEPFHHPYSISVFENTIFWSDWTTNSIQTTDKMHGNLQKRNVVIKLDTPILGLHMYHPVLMNATINPCAAHNCSHLCFVTSNTTRVCACPDGMELRDKSHCVRMGDYRARYLVVGGGPLFTRFQYDELGNPESHATHFDIGRVQAMAFDSVRDALYVYDGQMKNIKFINMSDFTLGVTHLIAYEAFGNVVDMDYDYATDNLYILDAGRRVVEVLSLRTKTRAYVHRFRHYEVPISLCLLPDYGRMLIALVESEEHNIIHIDSMGMHGEGRKHIVLNNLKGPHVRMRYVQHLNNVFISDESNGVIDYIHPDGTAKENYRALSTTVTSMAIADNYVFWTGRRSSRLFWSDIHETTHKIRKIDLGLFPNDTQLLLQATSAPPDRKDPLLSHPCLKNLCSDICVQIPHAPSDVSMYHMGYRCLCPAGLLLENGKCTKVVRCGEDQLMCHKSNVCIMRHFRCDGNNDCPFGEDEEGCIMAIPLCMEGEIYCNGICLNKKTTSFCNGKPVRQDESPRKCSVLEFECANSSICISRSQLCDHTPDCPNGDDEVASVCDTLSCYETEFMCASGSCIPKTWKCDGEGDCSDGSDEIECGNVICAPGNFQCRNRECIEVNKRCDGNKDCFDFSDEEDCEEPVLVDVTEPTRCEEWEFSCEHNTSICLPHNARCNMRVECPGATDEHGCDVRCAPHKRFACAQEFTCLAFRRVCDGQKNCADGSDETPDACAMVNRTSVLFPVHTLGECKEGYRCNDGQCVEWQQVCDNVTDCFNESDEKGLCATACGYDKCSYKCLPTPTGPHCSCPFGYSLGVDKYTCEDEDECTRDVCSQTCANVPGSFVCGCHAGYALRSDDRSCKAITGNMSILYVSGNSVRAVTTDGLASTEYTDNNVTGFNDLDYNVRERKLYVTSAEADKLVEVNETLLITIITNVGKPTWVSVDWVTGNVYFVDETPSNKRVRVCNVNDKRCAQLQNLPPDANVTAFIVDPSSRRMFYCLTREYDTERSVVWSASLSGRLPAIDLITVHHCTGLAVDSYSKKLYVAETGPAHIIKMDYKGISHNKTIAGQPQLQSPQGLAIFEDHIYYLVANSSCIGRCVLYGTKHCEDYIHQASNASKFVIRHETVQRDDLGKNECYKIVCSNVCALDEMGPVCICDDGTLAKEGKCPELEERLLPLFNGWSYRELQKDNNVTFSIVLAVMCLLLLYLIVFVYYHFVYKPRRTGRNYTEVRFQNAPSPGTSSASEAPTVQINTEESTVPHEFVNPLQYVRNMWYSSFRRRNRPIRLDEVAPTHPIIPSSPPQPQDLSDTESDMDDKEDKRFFTQKT